MGGFYSFAASFCLVCVVFSALHFLSPDGSFEKPVKYIICLAFICCILTSVTLIKKIISPQKSIRSSATYDSENISVTLFEQTFKTALKNSGINFDNLTVCTTKTASGSISITEVTVYTRESKESVCKVINPTGELNVRVVNE